MTRKMFGKIYTQLSGRRLNVLSLYTVTFSTVACIADAVGV